MLSLLSVSGKLLGLRGKNLVLYSTTVRNWTRRTLVTYKGNMLNFADMLPNDKITIATIDFAHVNSGVEVYVHIYSAIYIYI